ncbi:hypothetical protein [Amphibacillus jilinensis]|uniref:hypothetical protein n=1 Tax=Amphibacillus jilinensis TaxID=1216008 RepID=UPI00030D6A70|nr:hypothetical protein [Amphibacillus jilinensis]
MMKEYTSLFANIDRSFANLFHQIGDSVSLNNLLPITKKDIEYDFSRSSKTAIENDWKVMGEEVHKAFDELSREYRVIESN